MLSGGRKYSLQDSDSDCSGDFTALCQHYSYFATQWHFPTGTHQGAAKYLQRHTLLNPHLSRHLCPEEADVKHSWHRAGWHSGAGRLERTWEEGGGERLQVKVFGNQHVSVAGIKSSDIFYYSNLTNLVKRLKPEIQETLFGDSSTYCRSEGRMHCWPKNK